MSKLLSSFSFILTDLSIDALSSLIVFIFTNWTLILNTLSLVALFFFINTINLVTLWYLAGIYLLTLGGSLLLSDVDILVGFLWVIDLGVGLIFFIFILHFSSFLHGKIVIDKRSRILNATAFLFIIFLNITLVTSEPVCASLSVIRSKSWFFYVSWYDFYEVFFIQTISDLGLLKEIYFSQNSTEFCIINFVLLYGICASVLLTFLIKKIFTVLGTTQFTNLRLKHAANSIFFLRNQDFLKQQGTVSGTRVWSKTKNTKLRNR